MKTKKKRLSNARERKTLEASHYHRPSTVATTTTPPYSARIIFEVNYIIFEVSYIIPLFFIFQGSYAKIVLFLKKKKLMREYKLKFVFYAFVRFNLDILCLYHKNIKI